MSCSEHRTPEFTKAQRELDAAVEKFIRDSGWSDGGVTTGWVLVAHQAGFDDRGDETSSYPIVFMGGTLADHVAIGLLVRASDMIRGTGNLVRVRDDDDHT